MSCNVNPDKWLFGPKYVQAYAILDFNMKLLIHWERDRSGDEDYVHKKFASFHSCQQGVAATKWDFCTAKFKGDKCTEKNFTRYMQDYPKVVTKCTNLGD